MEKERGLKMFNKKLKDRLSKLEQRVKELEKINWEVKYPNGQIITRLDGALNYNFGYTIYRFKPTYNSEPFEIFRLEGIFYAYVNVFKSKILSNNKYLIYSESENVNYLVDTSNKTSVLVDKDMRVVI